MPSSTAKARIKAKAGSGTRRGDGIPRGWPVVAGIPRRYILRPQRDPDAREALNRPMAVRFAQRMLDVPGLLEQSRQGLRRLTGDVEPLDCEALELPRGEGALGGDPARGITAQGALTPRELEGLAVERLHVSREASETLTTLFEEARYIEHPLGEADRHRAIESLAGIRVALGA